MKTIVLGSVQYFFKYCLIRLAQEKPGNFFFGGGGGGRSNSSFFQVFSNFFRISYFLFRISYFLTTPNLISFSLTHYKTLF